MVKKLLLADDSITIQKVVELVLAEEDFEIKSVSNGEDALNALASYMPDIVLADIEMPKLNGYHLCEKIKKNPKTSSVPVILLAGAFEPIDEELYRKVGADDSVIKPFESQELISKINAALTMAPGGLAGEAAFAEVPAEEEAIEIFEEAEALQPEALGMATEEDLWAMEEVTEATAVTEAVPAEEEWALEEVEALEETAEALPEFEVPEEVAPEPVVSAPELADKTQVMRRPPPIPEVIDKTQVAPRPAPEPEMADKTQVMRRPAPMPSPEPAPAPRPQPVREAVVPEIAAPSREEIIRMFDKTINEKVSAALVSANIKDAMLSSMMPVMKESIEKILREITPGLVERTVREVLKGSVPAIAQQVEKVIWETVPDLASTMISKEIEKIKSEL